MLCVPGPHRGQCLLRASVGPHSPCAEYGGGVRLAFARASGSGNTVEDGGRGHQGSALWLTKRPVCAGIVDGAGPGNGDEGGRTLFRPPSLAGEHVPDCAYYGRQVLFHHLQLRVHHVDHRHTCQQWG